MSRVLIACEESQAVVVEMRALGIEAYSCDTEPCSGGHPEWHIQQDVTQLLDEEWDMIIAFPPCTYISKAGARFMYPTAGNVDLVRLAKAQKAKDFFMLFYNSKCKRICIENPTPLKVVGLPPHSQVVQPWMFGHPYSKRTLLWLKGLPPLGATDVVQDFVPFLPSNTGSFSRGGGGSRGVAHTAKDASKTFVGVAKAMADQWGRLLSGPSFRGV
jgi:hypothetical protein